MFQPTHLLVSRSKKIPVILERRSQSVQILTEQEWQQGQEPAFELRPKQGVFCKGISVVGYHLEPIEVGATEVTATDSTAQLANVPN